MKNVNTFSVKAPLAVAVVTASIFLGFPQEVQAADAGPEVLCLDPITTNHVACPDFSSPVTTNNSNSNSYNPTSINNPSNTNSNTNTNQVSGSQSQSMDGIVGAASVKLDIEGDRMFSAPSMNFTTGQSVTAMGKASCNLLAESYGFQLPVVGGGFQRSKTIKDDFCERVFVYDAVQIKLGKAEVTFNNAIKSGSDALTLEGLRTNIANLEKHSALLLQGFTGADVATMNLREDEMIASIVGRWTRVIPDVPTERARARLRSRLDKLPALYMHTPASVAVMEQEMRKIMLEAIANNVDAPEVLARYSDAAVGYNQQSVSYTVAGSAGYGSASFDQMFSSREAMEQLKERDAKANSIRHGICAKDPVSGVVGSIFQQYGSGFYVGNDGQIGYCTYKKNEVNVAETERLHSFLEDELGVRPTGEKFSNHFDGY